MKKVLLGFGLALMLGNALESLAQAPTDNAYQTFLDSRRLPRAVPHWTDSLPWTRVFNIQNYQNFATPVVLVGDVALNWLPAFERAQNDAVAAGGGVVYFPRLPQRRADGFEREDSAYYFADDVKVKSNIIIRGENPSADSSDARSRRFKLPTYFRFPKFEYDEGIGRPGGTANTTAFKSIIADNGATNNVAIVNVDINRGGIFFQPNFTSVTLPGGNSTQHAVRGMYNILVLGVRNNNVAEPSPNVPSNNIDSWHRWPYRFSCNINLFVDRNAVIANCRLNDFTNNDNTLRIIERDDFQQNNYKPNNTPGGAPLPGNQATFRYTDHYGVSINRLKRPVRFGAVTGFVNYATQQQEPSLYATGVMVHDSWIYKTQRVGVHVGGRGLQVLRNTIEDDSNKVSFLDPTGVSYINPNNPIVTFENRGIDFNGWDARVADNDIAVYRTILQPLSNTARSADGEGFYSQGQGGVNPRNVTITGNTVRTSLVGLQNAVQGATKKGVNGLTLVDEVLNLTIKHNKLNGTPIELNAGGGTLSNCVIDSNENAVFITSIGNNGGAQCYITNNTGYTAPLPLGQNIQRAIQRNCHVSLNPDPNQSTVNTNVGLTPNACQAVTNPFPCLTPPPTGRMSTPSRDTTVDATVTNFTLKAVFNATSAGGCNIQAVSFYRDDVLIGAGTQENATVWSFDITLSGIGSSNYYSAKADLNDGVTSYIVETAASNISQIVVSLDERLARQPISVFPNPSTGRMTLKAEGGEAGYAVQVLDALGRSVYTGRTFANETELNLEGVAKGIYRVVVSNGKHRQVTRIAIQ